MLRPSNLFQGTNVNIEALKQQVESAIALFTLVDERNLSFCQGLMDSLKAIETKHLERRAETAQLEEEIERMTQENRQLRAILLSLLAAVGLDRDRKLDEIRARLEQRISRLAQASDVASGTKGGGDLDSAPHHENETFAVPDASINDIVKRISRTSATAMHLISMVRPYKRLHVSMKQCAWDKSAQPLQ